MHVVVDWMVGIRANPVPTRLIMIIGIRRVFLFLSFFLVSFLIPISTPYNNHYFLLPSLQLVLPLGLGRIACSLACFFLGLATGLYVSTTLA